VGAIRQVMCRVPDRLVEPFNWCLIQSRIRARRDRPRSGSR
jgi:hypothetical protein